MSNVNVGTVYQQIIRDVIETSRVDFEEGGVDEGVLDELARGWQKKLSSLGVAQFPWDPKPEPTPPSVMTNPSSNYHMEAPPAAAPQAGFSLPTLPPMQSIGENVNGMRIKAEPGIENGLGMSPYNTNSGKTAQERAAQNLQGMYGSRAAASINAIQSNLPQQGQQQNSQQQAQQRAGQQSNQRPAISQAQYQQMLAEQTARQRAAKVSGIGNGQTDGADDAVGESIGILKRIDDQGQEFEVGRVEIDHMIRRKIEAMGRSMEGGGLMLPLKKRTPSSKSKRRNISASNRQSGNPVLQAAMNAQSSAPPQYDGMVDDDDEDDKDIILKVEDDEDAINSDLDDPDEGLNEEEDDDEAMGHIMLCMYDKVQRVKNKWKCVMKDGVLTVNGKEYVFHKATGEYEW